MRVGAGISGGAHAAMLIAAALVGEFSAEAPARPVAIAEVTMMTGTEFEAATSSAPEFNADLPPSPVSPVTADDRADLTTAETDAAPSAPEVPDNPDAPVEGEEVIPPTEQPPDPSIAETVGDAPAAPPAPEDDVLVAIARPEVEAAPVAPTPVAPTPAARPSRPAPQTVSPAAPAPTPTPSPETAEETPPAEPDPEAAPEETPQTPEPVETAAAPEPPAPTPAPEAEAPDQPDPADAVEAEPAEVVEDADEAPALTSPPPRKKPKALAEAAKSQRLARAARTPEESGATETAETPQSAGTTQTVGQLSFRDKDSLRVGIRGFFSPPRGAENEDRLAVKLRIELTPDGRIVSGPDVLEPGGRLSAQHAALMRAGVRALKKSEAAGVFAKLPKDKHARWRVMNVIFTPREITFL